MNPPTCVNCMWSYKGELYLWCKSPNRYLDVVTGEPAKMLCDSARHYKVLCGSAGEWFEPKETL